MCFHYFKILLEHFYEKSKSFTCSCCGCIFLATWRGVNAQPYCVTYDSLEYQSVLKEFAGSGFQKCAHKYSYSFLAIYKDLGTEMQVELDRIFVTNNLLNYTLVEAYDTVYINGVIHLNPIMIDTAIQKEDGSWVMEHRQRMDKNVWDPGFPYRHRFKLDTIKALKLAFRNAIGHMLTDMQPGILLRKGFAEMIRLKLPSCWRVIYNTAGPYKGYEFRQCEVDSHNCCEYKYYKINRNQGLSIDYQCDEISRATELSESQIYCKSSNTSQYDCFSICPQDVSDYLPQYARFESQDYEHIYRDGLNFFKTDYFQHYYRLGNEYDESIDESNSSFTLFPNPSDNTTELRFNSDIKGKVKVKVLNSSGFILNEIIADKTNQDFDLMLDMGKYPSGMYIINVFINESYYGSEKLILNK